MKKFKWLLNWSLDNIETNQNDIIPVYYCGRVIGKVEIIKIDNHTVGAFDLDVSLDDNDYVLYMISVALQGKQHCLTGITILPSEEGDSNRSRTVSQMDLYE